ncbi:MAG: hypothetical protein ABFR53_08115, partial [Actinomycetota bacterium]
MFLAKLIETGGGTGRRILMLAVAALMVLTTLALIPGAPLGPDPAHGTTTMTPITDFEIDGNLVGDGGGDWLAPYGIGTTANDGYPTTGLYYLQENMDVCGSDDDDVADKSPAVKLADGPIWRTDTGSATPAKNDLHSVWIGAEKVDVLGQINDILYMAFVLCEDPNSEFQIALSLEGGDGIPPFNPPDTPTGSTDDLLVVFNFQPSLGTATALVHEFDGTEWGEATAFVPGVDWEAGVIPGGTVGEVAINLTATDVLPEDRCANITVADQVATLNGNALESGVNDIVVVEPLVISNCGSLEVEKISEPAVTSTDLFDYKVSQIDIKPVYWDVPVIDGGLDVSGVNLTSEPTGPVSDVQAQIQVGQTDIWDNVISQPDYTIEETALPPGWALGGISCTYIDIFDPGPQPVTSEIYIGDVATGETFLIPPDIFPGVTPSTTCTITNTTSGVEIVKTGAGDPAQLFDVGVTGTDGTDETVSVALGDTSDVVAVTPGTPVVVEETLPATTPAWTHLSTVCTYPGEAGPVEVWNSETDGSLVAEFDTIAGVVITCTVENEQNALIIVEKQTLPDGNATLFEFTGTELNSPGLGDGQTIEAEVAPGGPYTSTEIVPTGWDLTDISCDDPESSGDIGTATATFNVAAGQTVKCTFTNTEIPTLQLVKTVTTDHGGSAVPDDWDLTAVSQGSDPSRDINTPGGSGVAEDVFADTVYDLDEANGPTGYTPGAWNCVGGTQVGSTIELAPGESSVCTIDNDDDPASLLLVKDVVLDNGGTAVAADWTLSAGANSVPGSATPIEVTDVAGTYALSETTVAGYTNTSLTCDDDPGVEVTEVTIGLGETITCTFVNDDDAPSLLLLKEVVNDNGGTAVAADWTLSAGANSVPGSATPVEATDQAGTYALSETTVAGYTNTSLTCNDDPGVEVTEVTIGLGETIICRFINDDDPASLLLVKDVVLDNGGTAVAADWTLSAGANDVTGSATPVEATDQAGTYALSETSVAGYTNTSLTCDDDPGVEVTEVTIGLGETITCTFVNDDDAPGLTLIKNVINNNGGDAVAADWTLSAGANDVTGSELGELATDQVGTYALSETTVAGYTNTSITCDDDPGVEVTEVTIGLGETISCTFDNDDDPASLLLVKDVVNDNGGTVLAGNWTLSAGANDVTGSATPVEATDQAGTYALSETTVAGYTNTSLTCDD